MNLCACKSPLPDPDTLSCVLCGKGSVAALERRAVRVRVDPLDVQSRYRRRVMAQYARNTQ